MAIHECSLRKGSPVCLQHKSQTIFATFLILTLRYWKVCSLNEQEKGWKMIFEGFPEVGERKTFENIYDRVEMKVLMYEQQ